MLLLAAVAAADTTDVGDIVEPAIAIAIGIVVAVVLAAVVGALTRYLGRRSAIAQDLSRRARRPFRVVLVVIAVWVALRLSTDPAPWVDVVEHGLLIALIISVTWLIGAMTFAVEDLVLEKYRVDVPDNRHARRIRTQITVVRRVTVALLVLVGAAAVLLTFPAARTFGASLLASAGLISIVAGLAAQTSLANAFAGMQIAFTDAIRVDDVVVVDDEWGRIEEITMTYVVVHVWDDRRLIMPSTYFTTTPFQNWTRRAADLLGTIELDLDWAVPVEAMRDELHRLLDATDLWDERVGVLQVTEATGGFVRIRALASAADAPTLFDLRCYVREGLVRWLQEEAPHALPRTRVEGVDAVAGVGASRPAGGLGQPEPVTGETPARAAASDGAGPVVTRRSHARNHAGDTQQVDLHPSDSRLFTGSIDAIERSRAFSGPGPGVIEEREEAAERADGGKRSGGAPRDVRVVGPVPLAQARKERTLAQVDAAERRSAGDGPAARATAAGLTAPDTAAGEAPEGAVVEAPAADPDADPATPERRSVARLVAEPRNAPLTPAEATAVLGPIAAEPEPPPAPPAQRPQRRHVGSGPLPVTPDPDPTGPRHGAPPDGETARDDR